MENRDLESIIEDVRASIYLVGCAISFGLAIVLFFYDRGELTFGQELAIFLCAIAAGISSWVGVGAMLATAVLLIIEAL